MLAFELLMVSSCCLHVSTEIMQMYSIGVQQRFWVHVHVGILLLLLLT